MALVTRPADIRKVASALNQGKITLQLSATGHAFFTRQEKDEFGDDADFVTYILPTKDEIIATLAQINLDRNAHIFLRDNYPVS